MVFSFSHLISISLLWAWVTVFCMIFWVGRSGYKSRCGCIGECKGIGLLLCLGGDWIGLITLGISSGFFVYFANRRGVLCRARMDALERTGNFFWFGFIV